MIATRALIQKWQNDGSISDAEFAKLSGLVSREQAALESVQVAEPVVPTPKPVPLSQFKVESTDEKDYQAPIVLSKYSVNETDQTDDDSAESDSELASEKLSLLVEHCLLLRWMQLLGLCLKLPSSASTRY